MAQEESYIDTSPDIQEYRPVLLEQMIKISTSDPWIGSSACENFHRSSALEASKMAKSTTAIG